MLCFDFHCGKPLLAFIVILSTVSAVPFRPQIERNHSAEIGGARNLTRANSSVSTTNSTNSTNILGLCGLNVVNGPSCNVSIVSTSTRANSTLLSQPYTLSHTTVSVSTTASSKLNSNSYTTTTSNVSTRSTQASTVTSAAAVSSISCNDAEYWAPTVSNWAEEDVDAKLSSWAFNLVPNPPTAIIPGSYPTQLPPPFTSFGNTSEYNVVGMAGQLMSIANRGMDASCQLVDGTNGQCPSVTVTQACGNMPRWAYLAWTAIYNMYSIHVQINAVVLDSSAYELGQAPEIASTFAPQPSDKGTEILLSIIGSIVTVIGVLIPLSAVGGGAILEMENSALAAATEEGGILGRIGATLGKGGGEEGTEDPDAIVSAGQPNVQPAQGGNTPVTPLGIEPAPAPKPGGGTTPVAVKPGGGGSRTNDPTFIGNALWVGPGIMTSMANTIWQESKAVTNPDAKANLDEQAVVDYMTNQSLVLGQYNDALLVNTDNASIQNFLSVLAGASFIETSWSQAMFETALSADVMSREINTAWQSPAIGLVYVSYTQLYDNPNGTICNATHIGVRSTQVCADTGVYYLSMLNTQSFYPSIQSPPGFEQLLDYGIVPYWPVSASATYYRALNPDGNVVPPIITTTNDSIFADYMSAFATTNPYDLLATVGRMPTEWSFPTCDQGRNFWTYDWSNTGGYIPSEKQNYDPVPCACGYQGSGTQAFYEALGATDPVLAWVYASCLSVLNSVDPTLTLTTENIGWNAISGGPPAKEIVYGGRFSISVPTTMPKPCYLGTSNCGKTPQTQPAHSG